MFKRIHKNKLKINPLSKELYGEFSLSNPYDFDLRQTILKKGILEKPIVTKDYLIISGNRRVKAILDVPEIQEIEVDVKNISSNEVDKFMFICHQVNREKDIVTLAWEYNEITKILGIKSGIDNPDALAEREEIFQNHKKKMKSISRVLDSKRYYKELYNSSEKKAWEYIKEEIRYNKKTASSLYKILKKKIDGKNNQKIIKDFDISPVDPRFKVYWQSNSDLTNIVEDESIDCVMTSPVYFNMKEYVQNYKLAKGKKQAGQEKSSEEYLQNLLVTFKEVIRTLKKTGSLWVNMNEPRVDGEYLNISGRFVELIRSQGLSFLQPCIWFKSNPVYSPNKDFQYSFEYLFHFAKNKKKYKWRNDWFGKEDKFLGKIVYGGDDKQRKIRNVFIYPAPNNLDSTGIGLIETEVYNNHGLKKILEKKGLVLRHNAIYALEIPYVCLASTTDKGDRVMDVYNGTGSTGLISWGLGLDYIGVEIEKEYVVQSIINFEDFKERNRFLEKN